MRNLTRSWTPASSGRGHSHRSPYAEGSPELRPHLTPGSLEIPACGGRGFPAMKAIFRWPGRLRSSLECIDEPMCFSPGWA